MYITNALQCACEREGEKKSWRWREKACAQNAKRNASGGKNIFETNKNCILRMLARPLSLSSLRFHNFTKVHTQNKRTTLFAANAFDAMQLLAFAVILSVALCVYGFFSNAAAVTVCLVWCVCFYSLHLHSLCEVDGWFGAVFLLFICGITWWNDCRSGDMTTILCIPPFFLVCVYTQPFISELEPENSSQQTHNTHIHK